MILQGHVNIVIIIFIIIYVEWSETLYCQQCLQALASQNGSSTEQCLEGNTNKSLCTNKTHTHCIVNFYREFQEKIIFILWRKCGIKSDITPCAVFDLQLQGDQRVDVSSYVHSVKNKSINPFVLVESAVEPRPGLFEVCSVDAEDCPSADACFASKNTANTVSFLPIRFNFCFVALVVMCSFCKAVMFQ